MQGRALEVPINTAYRGDLLQYIVDQSHARAVVIDEEFITTGWRCRAASHI